MSELILQVCSKTSGSHPGEVGVEFPDDFLEVLPGSDAGGSRRPNVFFYLMDTVRADGLGVYGSPLPTSPRIDEFAKDSVVYQHAYASSSWTLPSVVSLLTGVNPYRHQVMTGSERFSDKNAPALSTLLSASGYQTVGISQSFVASSKFGIDTGFGHFYENDQLHSAVLGSQATRGYLLDWLYASQSPSQPFFAYIHTVDCHAPYTPPEGFRQFADRSPGTLPVNQYDPLTFMREKFGSRPAEVSHLRGLYDGEVRYTDSQFGKFVDMLKHLGIYENSMIVLVADHGEEFGEHGGFDHGRTMYGELLRVPLVIKYPHEERGGTVETLPVSLTDVTPTVLAVTATPYVEGVFDGRDVSKRPPLRRMIYSEERAMPSAPFLGEVDYRGFLLERPVTVRAGADSDELADLAPAILVPLVVRSLECAAQ